MKSPLLTALAAAILAAAVVGCIAVGFARLAHAQTLDPSTTHHVSEPQPLADGRSVTLSVYYVAPLKTYFAGCLATLAGGAKGYQILPAFAHWYADDETDLVELSQSLKGVLAAHGGLPKFMLRLLEYGTECAIDLNGYSAANQAGTGFTTPQLLKALSQWKMAPTAWPGLQLFWPSQGAPPS